MQLPFEPRQIDGQMTSKIWILNIKIFILWQNGYINLN